jgi:small subunit ribosomal protein S5
VRVPLIGTTIPHAIIGTYRSSQVKLIPAAPGTGVIAGKSPRAILEAAGIRDILTKAYGSTNAVNLVKATFDGLMKLRTRTQVAKLRGVELA